MKFQKTEGIILRRVSFGDADRIITIITPEGKFGALAKGVRRPQSKLAAGIEPLSKNQLTLLEGRGELMTLTSARPVQVWSKILSDYERLELANNFMKTADRLPEAGAGGEYFAPLEIALTGLNQPEINAHLIELWFYLRVLALSGRHPELKSDSESQSLEVDKRYSLDPASGRLISSNSGALSGSHIKLWRLCVTNDFDLVVKIGGAEVAASESVEDLRKFVDHQNF